MTGWLTTVDAADVEAVATGLATALQGAGPALLPLPAGPAERDRLLGAARPDEPCDVPLPAGDVPALVVPTSGSTGEPKLAVLTARAVLGSAHAAVAALGGPGAWWLRLPLTHVAGLMVVARAHAAAAPLVVPEQVPGGGAGEGPTGRAFTSLVPTQLTRALDAGEDLSGFRAVLLGGGPVSPVLLERAAAAGVTVVRTYGMTETCGGCVWDGVPLPGVTVDLRPDGRLRVAGPVVAAGYLRRPDLTDVAFPRPGVFVTADLGRFDDGRLQVLGRADDAVTTGGLTVAVAEVERALGDLPGVAEACVVGLPDPEWGEHVVAALVLTSAAAAGAGTTDSRFDAASVRRALRDRLPAEALPRAVVVLPDLPRGPGGKPDRAALRHRLATLDAR